jgi:hypothetical protein
LIKQKDSQINAYEAFVLSAKSKLKEYEEKIKFLNEENSTIK